MTSLRPVRYTDRVGSFVVPHEPVPSLDTVKDGFDALVEKARARVRPDDLDARDPAFIARVMPLLGVLYDHYFRTETEFVEPFVEGPALVVANHNAMTGTPDMFCHMLAFWRTYSPARRSYGLMHDLPFGLPGAGPVLNAMGAIKASPINAARALDQGAAVLVFPGGDLDACRPFSRRYEIEFGKRRGFVRTALRHGVPIVPIVSAGAHHSLYVMTDGRKIAEALGLPDIMRWNVAPIGLALPWGLFALAPLPHLPPPVKIHTRILAPIRPGLPASAADDPDAVEHVFTLVRDTMQGAMDELKRLGRHGLFPKP
ncbi:MAG: 1-acyl-sn-glycerol-3-phosphate acyltransferase [Polyangiaceae bacterium]|nr:1-acyl-sn-glycerol-3-phosphate acyltransferase [Polyangiaceae bacterium]